MKTKGILDSKREGQFMLWLYVFCFIGIFYSTFITSLSLLVIIVYSFSFANALKFRKFFADFSFSPFVLIFLLVLLSGINTSEVEPWLIALRVKLPFLLLPIAYFFIPTEKIPLSRDTHFILLLIAVLVSIPVLAYALTHKEAVLDLISKGQPVPTPIEHVKYSMINSYVVISSLYLLIIRWDKLDNLIKSLTIAGITIIFIMLHVLAVRTGLVITYVSLSVLVVILIIKYSKRKLGFAILSGAVGFALASYFLIPSIQQKIGYMRYDWHQYESKEGSHYSDSERRMTANAAVNIWQSQPIVGVGYGDVKKEVSEWVEKKYDVNINKLPHSQFLLVLSGAGLIGILLFIFGNYAPFIKAFQFTTSGVLLLFLYLNYTLSFAVENSLERSMSTAFFLVIALLMVKNISTDSMVRDEKVD